MWYKWKTYADYWDKYEKTDYPWPQLFITVYKMHINSKHLLSKFRWRNYAATVSWFVSDGIYIQIKIWANVCPTCLWWHFMYAGFSHTTMFSRLGVFVILFFWPLKCIVKHCHSIKNRGRSRLWCVYIWVCKIDRGESNRIQ